MTQQEKPHRSERAAGPRPGALHPLTPPLHGKTQVRGGRPGQLPGAAQWQKCEEVIGQPVEDLGVA